MENCFWAKAPVGKHDIGAGSSQQAIMTALIVKPLARIGLKMTDIDRYATELHNLEVTLPSGSGNTPYTNYKIIAAMKQGTIKRAMFVAKGSLFLGRRLANPP